MAKRSVPSVELTVQRSEWLTPRLVRVVLGGPGFEDFVPNGFSDQYIKLVFGTADEPVMRTYTIRWIDHGRREIAVDFVVHGDEGVAGPWAATVQPGERVAVRGPGGAYLPGADAPWHLMAGDESAVPAIAASVEALPGDAIGYVFIEIGDETDRIPLRAPEGVEVAWVRRDAAGDGTGVDAPLVGAVRGARWLDGVPHVFVHGEAETVMKGIRPYIRKERGVPAERASISGYWRRGRTEEGFRVWKSELAAAEAPG